MSYQYPLEAAAPLTPPIAPQTLEAPIAPLIKPLSL